MNIDRLLSKKVKKLTVKDLKNALNDADDESEIVLCFNWKDGEEKVFSCYLADVLPHLKYDSVLGERMNDNEVVELAGFNNEYCTYVEKK